LFNDGFQRLTGVHDFDAMGLLRRQPQKTLPNTMVER
jgi:hypothetical protein